MNEELYEEATAPISDIEKIIEEIEEVYIKYAEVASTKNLLCLKMAREKLGTTVQLLMRINEEEV